MGEVHKASLDGLKLDDTQKKFWWISLLIGGWFTIWVWFTQKDDAKKSQLLKLFIFQWLSYFLCGLGYIWVVYWAYLASKQ